MPQESSDWQAMRQHFQAQPQLLDRLVGMLARTLGDIRGELAQAISTQNLDALAKVAHNIKGTALNLHTPDLARLAIQTQEQARQQHLGALESAQCLSSQLDQFLDQVSRHQTDASMANSTLQ